MPNTFDAHEIMEYSLFVLTTYIYRTYKKVNYYKWTNKMKHTEIKYKNMMV
jgi:hypothetical protein